MSNTIIFLSWVASTNSGYFVSPHVALPLWLYINIYMYIYMCVCVHVQMHFYIGISDCFLSGNIHTHIHTHTHVYNIYTLIKEKKTQYVFISKIKYNTTNLLLQSTTLTCCILVLVLLIHVDNTNFQHWLLFLAIPILYFPIPRGRNQIVELFYPL